MDKKMYLFLSLRRLDNRVRYYDITDQPIDKYIEDCQKRGINVEILDILKIKKKEYDRLNDLKQML